MCSTADMQKAADTSAVAKALGAIANHTYEEAFAALAGLTLLMACMAGATNAAGALGEDAKLLSLLLALLIASAACWERIWCALGRRTQKSYGPEVEAPPKPWWALRLWQRRRLLSNSVGEKFDRMLAKMGLECTPADQPCGETWHKHKKAVIPDEVVRYRSSSLELCHWMPNLLRPLDLDLASWTIPEDEEMNFDMSEQCEDDLFVDWE